MESIGSSLGVHLELIWARVRELQILDQGLIRHIIIEGLTKGIKVKKKDREGHGRSCKVMKGLVMDEHLVG